MESCILSGYGESCTGFIKDLISQKAVATGRGVGTEWAYMYKIELRSIFLKDLCSVILES